MVTGIALILSIASGPTSARENRRGLDALRSGDTASALGHLAKAARDSTDPRYAFNLGTVQSLARKPGADAAFDRALRSSRSSDDSARVFYNRGTSRLDAARSGRGNPSQAVQDLREALRRKPGWNEAARNLELALRLARPQGGGGGKDDRKKQPGKDPKPQGGDPSRDKKDGQGDSRPQPTGMSRDDAERMLDGAQAQEQKQVRKPTRREESDGPDW